MHAVTIRPLSGGRIVCICTQWGVELSRPNRCFRGGNTTRGASTSERAEPYQGGGWGARSREWKRFRAMEGGWRELAAGTAAGRDNDSRQAWHLQIRRIMPRPGSEGGCSQGRCQHQSAASTAATQIHEKAATRMRRWCGRRPEWMLPSARTRPADELG